MQIKQLSATEYYQTILNTVNEGLIVIDRSNSVTFANRAAIEILGYRVETFLGQQAHRLWHHSHMDGTAFPLNECPIHRACQHGEPWQGTDVFWRSDGTAITVEVSAVPMQRNGITGALVIRFRDISARVKLHEELRTSETAYEMLFNNLPVGVYRTSIDGKILMANSALLDMLGYESLAELATVNLETANIMGYSRAEFRARMKRDGEIVGLQSKWRRKDGTPVYLRESVRAVKDSEGNIVCFEGVLENITQQRQDALLLEREEARFRAISQTASDAIIMVGVENTVVFWNDAAAKMFGYTAAEILAQPLSLIIPERLKSQHYERFTAVSNGDPSRIIGKAVEVVARRKDGTEFPVELSLAKWTSGDEVFFIGILRDISRRKKLEKMQRQYEFIVNTSNQMMTFIDAKHRFTAVSDAYCRAHRKSREDLVGKTVAEVWSEESYQNSIKPNLDRAFAGQMFHFHGWVNLAAYGRRYVKVTYSPYRNHHNEVSHVVVVTQDLTDFKQTQDALERNIRETELAFRQAKAFAESLQKEVAERQRIEQTLAQLLNQTNQLLASIPLILVGVQADGTISHWNEPAENTFGLSASAMVGQTFCECAIAWRWQRIESAINVCKANQQALKLEEVEYIRPSGEQGLLNITLSPFRNDISAEVGVLLLADDITEHREALEARRMLETVVQQADESVVVTDTNGGIQYVNPAFERITGYTAAEVLGKTPRILKSGRQSDELYRELWATITAGKVWRGRLVNKRKDGSLYTEDASISPIFDEHKNIVSFVGVKHDVSRELQLEAQRNQAQKMEAIGQLAAGIAHEINTPTQFIGDNIGFLQTAFQRLNRIVAAYQSLVSTVETMPDVAETVREVREIEKSMKLTFLLDEIPYAIEEAEEGIERVANIVNAMKDFSHPNVHEKIPTDLNRIIQSTIIVSRNEWKYVAEMITDFDPDLPLVPCLPGEINQAILNIIVNAAHAIGDVIDRDADEKGRITVTTRRVDDWAEIRIADTGTGIPPEHQPHIFDLFYTTKDVGKGTGQGLAITYHIIVEKHHGTLHFETAENEGTIFIIRLPLSQT